MWKTIIGCCRFDTINPKLENKSSKAIVVNWRRLDTVGEIKMSFKQWFLLSLSPLIPHQCFEVRVVLSDRSPHLPPPKLILRPTFTRCVIYPALVSNLLRCWDQTEHLLRSNMLDSQVLSFVLDKSSPRLSAKNSCRVAKCCDVVNTHFGGVFPGV